jgi:predicted 2-oxoglutarate/Fe(II)-dependent dioxygenase YbiX
MYGIDSLTLELGKSVDNIKVIEDFVDKEDLNSLIKYGLFFEYYKKNKNWPPGIEIPQHIHEMVTRYEDKMISCASSLYGKEFEKDRSMDFSYRHENSSVSIHADNVMSDIPGARVVNSDNLVWSGHLSVICYLNDSFLGGEIFFPNQNFKYSPKTGDAIMFPGTNFYQHEVKQFTGSPRITMSIWTRFADYTGEEANA